MITSALHPREWTAFESVVYFLQDLKGNNPLYPTTTANILPFVDPNNFNTTSLATARPRLAYFVDNLEINLIPLVNPGGIAVTQRYHDACDILLTTLPGPGADLNVDSLRDGRMRRKNLNNNDGKLAKNPSTDTDDLNGVNVEVMDQSAPTTISPLASDYPGGAALGNFENEAIAVRSALEVMDIPALPTKAAFTGVAALDVHTRQPTPLVAFHVTPFQPTNPLHLLFASSVRDSVGGASNATLFTNASPGVMGYLLDVGHGIPQATLELPDDPALADSYFDGTPSAPAPPRAIAANTRNDLRFLVTDGTKTLRAQAGLTASAIDATLNFAAGPPYLAQALVLQKKNAATTSYDVTATGGAAEVLSWKRWQPNPTAIFSRQLIDIAQNAAVGNRWMNAQTPVTIVLSFSKPMASNATDPAPSADVLATSRSLGLIPAGALAGGRWVSHDLLTLDNAQAPTKILALGCARYDFDTFVVSFTPSVGVTSSTVSANARLSVGGRDQVGFALDGNPATVATYAAATGTFSGYEDSVTRVDGNGGLDQNHAGLKIDTVRPVLRKPQ